ncbi:MAG: hypothetical protein R3F21_22885 [Myxococcota bacterium]
MHFCARQNLLARFLDRNPGGREAGIESGRAAQAVRVWGWRWIAKLNPARADRQRAGLSNAFNSGNNPEELMRQFWSFGSGAMGLGLAPVLLTGLERLAGDANDVNNDSITCSQAVDEEFLPRALHTDDADFTDTASPSRSTGAVGTNVSS